MRSFCTYNKQAFEIFPGNPVSVLSHVRTPATKETHATSPERFFAARSTEELGHERGIGGEKSWNCSKYPEQAFSLNETPKGERPLTTASRSPTSRAIRVSWFTAPCLGIFVAPPIFIVFPDEVLRDHPVTMIVFLFHGDACISTYSLFGSDSFAPRALVIDTVSAKSDVGFSGEAPFLKVRSPPYVSPVLSGASGFKNGPPCARSLPGPPVFSICRS